jgi:hypothetical protein
MDSRPGSVQLEVAAYSHEGVSGSSPGVPFPLPEEAPKTDLVLPPLAAALQLAVNLRHWDQCGGLLKGEAFPFDPRRSHF